MNNTGVVIKAYDTKLDVKIDRKSACSSCGANCDGNCAHEIVLTESAKTFILTAENTVGAQVGDIVEIAQEGGNALMYAFMIFFLPIALAVFTYMISESILWSGVAFALFFGAFVFIANRNAVKNMKIYTLRIKRKGNIAQTNDNT